MSDETNKRPSNTEFYILDGMISHQRFFGSDLCENDKRIKNGSVYVLLSRMSDKGWVARSPGHYPNHPSVPRHRYVPTSEGRRVFEAEVAARKAFASYYPQGAPA